MDFTINWTSELSEGSPIPDYQRFRRDSEIPPTEYMCELIPFLNNYIPFMVGIL